MISFLLLLTFFNLLLGYILCLLSQTAGTANFVDIIYVYIFFVSSIIAIILTFTTYLRLYRDIFNPLLVIAMSMVIRILMPALSLLIFGSPKYLDWMNLWNEEWLMGIVLSLLATNSIIFGYSITPRFLIEAYTNLAKWLSKYFITTDKKVVLSAKISIFIGFVFVIIFYISQGGSAGAVAELVESGSLRNSAEANGSYRYMYIGLGLIYCSSTFLCASFLEKKNRKAFSAFIPSMAGSLLLFPLGGRIVSLNPLIFGLTSFWQIRISNKNLSFSKLIRLLLGIIIFLVYSYFLVIYRAGLGADNVLGAFNVSSFSDYSDSLLWGDISIIPVYALASTHEPGSMGGATYPLVLGILGQFLGIKGEIPGVFLVQNSFGNGPAWGPHTGMFVDIYLNSGIGFAIVGCAILGMNLRSIYQGLNNYFNTPIFVTLYTLLVWSFYWLFFESILAATGIITRVILTLLIQRCIFLIISKR